MSTRMSSEEFERLQAELDRKVKKRDSGTVPRPEQVASKPGSKHRNVHTKYRGVTYHSRAEAEYAAYLDTLLQAGEIISWMRQPRFMLVKPQSTARLILADDVWTYTADFLVQRRDHSCYVVDIKGHTKQRDKDVRAAWATFGIYPLHVIYNDQEIVIPAGVQS